MSIFEQLKEYINKLDDGEIFTRKDLHSYISDSHSVDVYRKGIQLAGYIRWSPCNKQGIYQKIKEIPIYVTASNYRNRELLEKLELSKKFEML